MEGTWRLVGCGENNGSRGSRGSSLKSEDYVSLARDWIRLFVVDSEVVVVPEDVWLRDRGARWAGGRVEAIALMLGLGDNAAHRAARFRCEGHFGTISQTVGVTLAVVLGSTNVY